MNCASMITHKRKIHALIAALIFSLFLGGCTEEYNMEEESDIQAEEAIRQEAEQRLNKQE